MQSTSTSLFTSCPSDPVSSSTSIWSRSAKPSFRPGLPVVPPCSAPVSTPLGSKPDKTSMADSSSPPKEIVAHTETAQVSNDVRLAEFVTSIKQQEQPSEASGNEDVQRNPRNHRCITSQQLMRVFHHHSLAGLRLSTTQLLPLPKNQILLPKVLLPLRLLFLIGLQLVLHNH